MLPMPVTCQVDRIQTFGTIKIQQLIELTQHIAFFNFTSANERNDLVRNATLNGIQESVRIFVAQLIEPYVAVSSLKGLINDFGAGITISIRCQTLGPLR